jgi:23S rRNA (pseudouridine1915-N3)-methyltransferase
MKLRLLWIEKTKDRHLAELIDDYLHRLAKYVKYDVLEIPAVRVTRERTAVMEAEAKAMLAALSPGTFKVMLDEQGRQFTSAQLAHWVEQRQIASTREIAFIIGGHFGLAASVKQQADLIWSLSALTFTHDMARLILAEQLYRAYTIIQGHPYQK